MNSSTRQNEKRPTQFYTSAPVASKVFQQKFNEGPNGGLMKEPRRVNGPFRVNKREFFKTTRQLFHSLKTKTKVHVIGTVSARWLWSIGRYDVRKVASAEQSTRKSRGPDAVLYSVVWIIARFSGKSIICRSFGNNGQIQLKSSLHILKY